MVLDLRADRVEAVRLEALSSTLRTTLRVFHDLDRTGTTVIPTGAKAIKANLMCWTPKGMPTMLTKQARAELR